MCATTGGGGSGRGGCCVLRLVMSVCFERAPSFAALPSVLGLPISPIPLHLMRLTAHSTLFLPRGALCESTAPAIVNDLLDRRAAVARWEPSGHAGGKWRSMGRQQRRGSVNVSSIFLILCPPTTSSAPAPAAPAAAAALEFGELPPGSPHSPFGTQLCPSAGG